SPPGLPFREIRLKYPLRDDYRGFSIARSSGKIGPASFPIQVLRRFKVENLRLESSAEYDVGLFGFGGCLDCTFRNLWLTQCANAFFMIVARCVFENIEVRYSKRLGELSYYCHDNVFRDIRSAYSWHSNVSAGNGWATNEGAHDNTFQRLHLNHGNAGAC